MSAAITFSYNFPPRSLCFPRALLCACLWICWTVHGVALLLIVLRFIYVLALVVIVLLQVHLDGDTSGLSVVARSVQKLQAVRWLVFLMLLFADAVAVADAYVVSVAAACAVANFHASLLPAARTLSPHFYPPPPSSKHRSHLPALTTDGTTIPL